MIYTPEQLQEALDTILIRLAPSLTPEMGKSLNIVIETLERYQKGEMTKDEIHNICHNLHGKVTAEEFCAGCAAEQRKLFGRAPDADEVAKLRAVVKALPDFNIEQPDAADFTDHAEEFMNAMRLARAAKGL